MLKAPKQLFYKFSKHPILSAPSVLLIGNVFTFLFSILQGRILSGQADAFGEFSSLNSFSYYFSIPITALVLVSSKLVAEWYANDEKEKIKYYVYTTTKRLMVIFVASSLFFVLLAPFIQQFLHLNDLLPLIILIFSFTFTIIPPTITGSIFGLHKFKYQAGISIGSATVRLIIGSILGIMFGVVGSISGNLFAAITTILLGIFFFYKINKNIKISRVFSINFPWKLFLGSLISTLAFGSFLSTDVVLIKHFLSNVSVQDSFLDAPSIYAALSVFGKIVYFLALTFSNALLPLASYAKAKKSNHKRLLNQTLFFVSVLLIPIIGAYFIIPNLLVEIIFGAEYLYGAVFLGFYGLSVSFYAIASILNNYFISQGKYSQSIIPASTAILQIILISHYHSSISDFIVIQLVVHFLTLISFIIYWWFNKS